MTYYSKDYFAWQKKAGEYGALIDITYYERYLRSSDTLLDFGCGGGYMLSKVVCKKKYGVDINEYARIEATKKGLKVYPSLDSLPKNIKFTRIMSHHTLEHLHNPLDTLVQLRSKLEKNGALICIVPIDDWRSQKSFKKKDINNHLYTWTPLLLKNLFKEAGYTIVDVKILYDAWVPYSRFYYTYIPKWLYNFMSKIWSSFILSRQIIIVARRGN